MDDEPEFLEAGTALIERLGYRVVPTDNGFDAMRHLSDNPHSFDLVIIDMIMPGMGGRELYGHIRRLSPDTRILLSTGFSNASGISDILVDDQSDMICKPYTAEELSQKISKMMLDPGKTSMPSFAEEA